MDEVKYFKDSSNYWYGQCAKETQLRAEFEDKSKELKEWIDESTASNIQAYTDGFRQGYKEGEVKYDSEADSQSYADGYANGRKDGEAICVNRIKAMKYPKTQFE